jgi:LacI family transcriptional regulator
MAATIKEVAEKAGVSRGTVDRALHDRAGVNPEVALKVRKAAKELGYVPNPTAMIAGKSEIY